MIGGASRRQSFLGVYVLVHLAIAIQRLALKAKPINFLRVLRSNTLKKFIVVLLIENCCNTNSQNGNAILGIGLIRLAKQLLSTIGDRLSIHAIKVKQLTC